MVTKITKKTTLQNLFLKKFATFATFRSIAASNSENYKSKQKTGNSDTTKRH